MQPRKGPAWANDSQTATPANPEADQNRPAELSDLEWLKQRISKQFDEDEKAFEQSDDEHLDPPEHVEVYLCLYQCPEWLIMF